MAIELTHDPTLGEHGSPTVHVVGDGDATLVSIGGIIGAGIKQ